MALRGAKRTEVKDWRGLNTWADSENIAPAWWTDSMNVIVNQAGSAEVMRSPATFNDSTGIDAPVLSIFNYQKQSGPLTLFDVRGVSAGDTRTFSTEGTTNTLLRSGQADLRWKSLTVNDFAYRVNGVEFVKTDGTNFYSVGISGPATAPTIAYTGGGTGEITSGITVSYAYRNSTTLAVSNASDVSNALTASGANQKLTIDVVASTQTGVDGIVVFITTDGGVVRYLLVDVDGEPEVFSNSTATLTIDIADIYRDTLTEETVTNDTPPTNAYFMFRWKDRLFLCDFRATGEGPNIRYSGYESVAYGTPEDAWPPFNLLNIPNKAAKAKGGIGTVLGALILAEDEAYLLSGDPSDIVSAPETSITVSQKLEVMGWRIGTRSPYTLATTPFGEIWLDQTKRLQLWNHDGVPDEIGLTIRNLLDEIQDEELDQAEGVWFQHGKNGGNYVMTASTSGTTNNRLFVISIYKDPESRAVTVACGVSDIRAHSLGVVEVDGVQRCVIGAQGWMKEILSDQEGEGYNCQERFFEFTAGNEGEFQNWNSIRFDASSIVGTTVTVRNPDDTEERELVLEQEAGGGGSYFALVDEYGRRKVFKFSFSARDDTARAVKNTRIVSKNTGRYL